MGKIDRNPRSDLLRQASLANRQRQNSPQATEGDHCEFTGTTMPSTPHKTDSTESRDSCEFVASGNGTPRDDESQPIDYQQVTDTTSDPAAAQMQHPEAAEDAQEPRSSGAKKKRKGHGIPISREQKGDLIYQLAHGASLRQAAAVVQCHYSTVSRLLNHDPQFAASVARCQEFVAIEAFKNIRAAGRKEWKAAVWLLEYLERRSQRLQATERAQGDEA